LTGWAANQQIQVEKPLRIPAGFQVPRKRYNIVRSKEPLAGAVRGDRPPAPSVSRYKPDDVEARSLKAESGNLTDVIEIHPLPVLSLESKSLAHHDALGRGNVHLITYRDPQLTPRACRCVPEFIPTTETAV